MKQHTFLKSTFRGGLKAYFGAATDAFAKAAESLTPTTSPARMGLVAPHIEIMRPADLLNLRFEFVTLKPALRSFFLWPLRFFAVPFGFVWRAFYNILYKEGRHEKQMALRATGSRSNA